MSNTVFKHFHLSWVAQVGFVGGLLLIIYLLTMPSSISWAHYGVDGGDLATAIVLKRLPHPPGFPTYLALGSALVQLPWGEPAWRLNLLSALTAAGASATVALLVLQTTSSVASAIITGFLLGFAPLLWGQALIAEVYAPAALFAALVLFSTLWPTSDWVRGALWGGAIGAHPTLVGLAPLMLWVEGAGIRLDKSRTKCLLSALFTSLLLYGPWLFYWQKSPSPWQSFSTVQAWWGYVSGDLYRTYVFALPLRFWPQRLLAWAGLLVRQFTPVGILLALRGFFDLWFENRPLSVLMALSFGSISLFALGYNTTDSLVYLVSVFPIVSYWVGKGLSAWIARVPQPMRYGLFATGILALGTHVAFLWKPMNLRHDLSALQWSRETLSAAPAEAIVFTSQDEATFALWYVQDVLGVRPDVLIVDQDLLNLNSYRKYLEWRLDEGRLETAFSTRPVRKVQVPLENAP